MKVLVIFYSFTGTSHRVAQALCAQFGWAAGEVSDLRPGRGNWRCMLDSLLRRSPAIQYRGPPPETFDAVVLVAPIWMNRLAAPMRSFVRAYGKRLPMVAMISVMGSRGGANALAEVRGVLDRSPTLFTMFTSREVDTGAISARLQSFGKGVVGAATEQPVLRPAEVSMRAA